MDAADTIAAISTPLGEGGIGVVRVSGPAAVVVAAALFRGAEQLHRVDTDGRGFYFCHYAAADR